jgi:hypothetical protein
VERAAELGVCGAGLTDTRTWAADPLHAGGGASGCPADRRGGAAGGRPSAGAARAQRGGLPQHRGAGDEVAAGRCGALERGAGAGWVEGSRARGAGDVRRRRENDRGVNLERKYAVPLPPRGPSVADVRRPGGSRGGRVVPDGSGEGELATLLRTERRSEALFQLEPVAGRVRRAAGGGGAAASRGRSRGRAGGGADRAGGADGHAVVRGERSALPGWCGPAGARPADGEPCGRVRAHGGVVGAAAAERRVAAEVAAGDGALWQGREAGLEATRDIALDCAPFDLRWLRPPLPHFRVPAGHTTTRGCVTWCTRVRASGGASWTSGSARRSSTSWA